MTTTTTTSRNFDSYYRSHSIPYTYLSFGITPFPIEIMMTRREMFCLPFDRLSRAKDEPHSENKTVNNNTTKCIQLEFVETAKHVTAASAPRLIPHLPHTAAARAFRACASIGIPCSKPKL